VLCAGFDDYEIILIDDASPHSSWSGHEGLLDFIKTNEKIVYIREEENRGPGAARNKGIEAAAGEWLFFMDSDDIIYGAALPELADFLKNASARNADMIVFSEVMFRFPDGRTESRFTGGADGWLDKLFAWEHLIYNNNISQVWNYCYRKAFIVKNDIKCIETHHLEDISMSINAACRAKKAFIFPRCFYEYRLESKLSLDALGRECYAEQTKKQGRKLFFNAVARLCEADIPPDRKERVEKLLRRVILYSLYEPEAYRQNASVRGALNALREKTALYTGNWQKNIYISPCFFEAAAAAKLLDEFRIRGGGGTFAGFIDRDKTSPRAKECQRQSGFNVYTIDDVKKDIKDFSNSVILIFGIHADEIARGFAESGLIENKDFVKTGLI
jgi:glycosyltransferase involved in cell wall biosynthesis